MLEDILAGLSGALSGGLRGYSFEKELEAEEQIRKERENARLAAQADRDRERQENTRRYDEGMRLTRAGITADLLGPNAEIDDQTFALLQGTPYEARVDTRGTLPSRRPDLPLGDGLTLPGYDLPGGDQVRTWRPSGDQQMAIDERSRARDARAALPAHLQSLVQARDAGVPVSLDDLVDPTTRANDEEARWRRNQQFTENLIRTRPREPRAERLPEDDPAFDRDFKLYQEEAKQHDARMKGRVTADDPLTEAVETPEPYTAFPDFDAWRARRRGSAKGGIPVTPRATIAPMASHGRTPDAVPARASGGSIMRAIRPRETVTGPDPRASQARTLMAQIRRLEEAGGDPSSLLAQLRALRGQ
ncbi:MAG: hypothetical protein AB7G23_03115 [Vicinamibacterales bacterium]